MSASPAKLIAYKRSRFSTHLPEDFRYTPSHAWLHAIGPNQWRVGLTKFATRMLGEMVDHGFEVQTGAAIEVGQVVGWVEGFKAISDLYSVVQGSFAGTNGVLKQTVTLINQHPYSDGWLYEATGTPDPRAFDVHAYTAHLDRAIDKILEQEKNAEIQ